MLSCFFALKCVVVWSTGWLCFANQFDEIFAPPRDILFLQTTRFLNRHVALLRIVSAAPNRQEAVGGLSLLSCFS